MSEAQQFRNAERRTHQISHEELRRQLIAADAARYGLRHQLSGRFRRRRMTVSMGAAAVVAMVGAGLWERCHPSPVADNHQSDLGAQVFAVSAPTAETSIESEPLVQSAAIAPVAQIRAPQSRAPHTTEKPRRQSTGRAQMHLRHHSLLMRTLLRVKPHLWPAAWHRAAQRPLSPGESGRASS
jgi:hypothetical protein